MAKGHAVLFGGFFGAHYLEGKSAGLKSLLARVCGLAQLEPPVTVKGDYIARVGSAGSTKLVFLFNFNATATPCSVDPEGAGREAKDLLHGTKLGRKPDHPFELTLQPLAAAILAIEMV